jgi:hypothetical protein
VLGLDESDEMVAELKETLVELVAEALRGTPRFDLAPLQMPSVSLN